MQQFSARFCFQLILIFFDCCVFSFQSNEVFVVPMLFLIYCGCLVYVLVIIVILLVFCIFQVFEVQFLPRPLVIASLKCFFYYPPPSWSPPEKKNMSLLYFLHVVLVLFSSSRLPFVCYFIERRRSLRSKKDRQKLIVQNSLHCSLLFYFICFLSELFYQ